MRCSRCDMPLSPTKTSCPRCGTAIGVAAGGVKGQGELPFAVAQVPFEQTQQISPGFVGTAVEVAPIQHNWGQRQDTPFAAVSDLPITPLTSEKASSDIQEVLALPTPPQLPGTGNRTTAIGFGLAGLCTGVACLLLLFVYVIAQTLPATSNGSPARLGGSALVTQNTPTINPGPKATAPIASPTATYSGQQYITNAQTSTTINFATAQPTFPTSTFKVGQTIYITFSVRPHAQTGAICLLWYINATQFASYPFAISTTSTTAAYSYANTGNVGPGYVEIYLENAPSCLDPNKILGAHVDFTVTA